MIPREKKPVMTHSPAAAGLVTNGDSGWCSYYIPALTPLAQYVGEQILKSHRSRGEKKWMTFVRRRKKKEGYGRLDQDEEEEEAEFTRSLVFSICPFTAALQCSFSSWGGLPEHTLASVFVPPPFNQVRELQEDATSQVSSSKRGKRPQ